MMQSDSIFMVSLLLVKGKKMQKKKRNFSNYHFIYILFIFIYTGNLETLTLLKLLIIYSVIL